MARLVCLCGNVLSDVDEGRWRQFASFVLYDDTFYLESCRDGAEGS